MMSSRCCLPNPGSDGVGGFGPQPMCRHEMVGKRMPQRHRLGLDQAANRNEAEAMVLEVAVDPLDELAQAEHLLAGWCCHPAAPLLHALGFLRPLLRPLGERCRFDIL